MARKRRLFVARWICVMLPAVVFGQAFACTGDRAAIQGRPLLAEGSSRSLGSWRAGGRVRRRAGTTCSSSIAKMCLK